MSDIPKDDNFDELVSSWELVAPKLTVFLGAGASIGAKNKLGRQLPSAYELRNSLWQKFKHDPSKVFEVDSLKLMNLEHAAAICEAKVGRTFLSDFLVEQFTCALPMWQHLALPHLNPNAVLTTNYDELVELGYKGSTDLIDVICDARSPMSGHTPLYKPHGSLSHANQSVGKGGLVITQFDYFEMISEYREMLRKAMTGFNSTCVLLIGYSFGDMDIGAELFSIRQKNRGIPWYAVFPRHDPQVRKMYSNRFGIEQIDMTFEGFLAALDERVGFLPDNLKHAVIPHLRGQGRIQ